MIIIALGQYGGTSTSYKLILDFLDYPNMHFERIFQENHTLGIYSLVSIKKNYYYGN